MLRNGFYLIISHDDTKTVIFPDINFILRLVYKMCHNIKPKRIHYSLVHVWIKCMQRIVNSYPAILILGTLRPARSELQDEFCQTNRQTVQAR